MMSSSESGQGRGSNNALHSPTLSTLTHLVTPVHGRRSHGCRHRQTNGTGGVARRWFRSPSLPLPPRIGSLSKSLYIHIVKGSARWKQSECLAAYSHVRNTGLPRPLLLHHPHRLQTYEYQLGQVTEALQADPGNEELTTLKAELENLISLTRSLIGDAGETSAAGGASAAGPSKPTAAGGARSAEGDSKTAEAQNGSGVETKKAALNAGDECLAKYKVSQGHDHLQWWLYAYASVLTPLFLPPPLASRRLTTGTILPASLP